MIDAGIVSFDDIRFPHHRARRYMPASLANIGGAAGMTYPGGKNGAGIYERIINHMPPHETYIEDLLGSGAVLRNKRPAKRNVGIDRSVEALDLCLELAGKLGFELRTLERDALNLLPSLKSIVSDPF